MANDFDGPATLAAECRLICFDAFELDQKTAELRKAGKPITLHQQSFQILLALIQAQGGLVTKNELREILWPSDTQLDFDRSINKALAKLRSALGDSSEEPHFIETVRDRGYRFLVPVVFSSVETIPPCAHSETPNSAAEITSDSSLPRLIAFGAYEVDPLTPELRRRGVQIRIHPQSLQLLLLLLKRPGQLITREELQQLLWPSGTHVDFEASLKKAVSKLRIALGDSVEKPAYIETLPGRGYRFIAPVRSLSNSNGSRFPTPSSGMAHAVEAEGKESRNPQASLENVRWKLRSTYSVAIAAAIVFGCVVALYVHWQTLKAVTTLHSKIARPSIAVLDFRNLSGQPDEAWLSTALSEWLTTELAAGSQLRIIPGDQVMQMQMELPTVNLAAPTPNVLSQIRKILGTDFVVSGSYEILSTQGEEQILVALQLQDAESGKILKTISETGKKSDLFTLISQTGDSLRSQLGIHQATSEENRQMAAGLPSSPEAIRLYSEGLHKLRIGDAQTASELLQKAIIADPNDAHIHDALAAAWQELGYDFRANAESQKALSMAANLPREDHLLIEGRSEEIATHWDRAIEIYRALFEFFPDNLEYGLRLVSAETKAGKTKDAQAAIADLRQQLPPPLRDDPRIDLAEATAVVQHGDAKLALAADERALKKATADGASLLVAQAELAEGWAYMNLESFDKALACLSDARERFTSAGIQVEIANTIEAQGIAYNYVVDYTRAEGSFEESLAIFRRIGFRKGVARNLLSVTDIRLSVGDLPVARTKAEEALSVAEEIHDDDSLALAKYYLGKTLIRMANPEEARKMYQESLDIFERNGNRQWVAMSLLYLAETSRYQGNFDTALTEVNHGIEIYKKLSYEEGLGWSEALRAEIFLDQNRNQEAAAAAHDADASLAAIKDEPGQEVALALWAQALLQQGKVTEASKRIKEARTQWNGSRDPESGLTISLTEAMIAADSTSKTEKIEAEKKMRGLISEANRMGFMDYAFEIRFELGKMELSNDNQPAANDYLKVLLRDANHKGMGLIAQKVTKLTNSNSLSPQNK